MTIPPTLILGVGNILLGDEGIGVHIAQQLQKRTLPPSIEVVDGGTLGFELLHFCENRQKIIIIDTILTNEEPGTVIRAKPDELDLRWTEKFSAHDNGLKELLSQLTFISPKPDIIIFGIVPASITPSMEISTSINNKIPAIISHILREASR